MNLVKLPDGWSMAALGDVADEAVERSGPVSSEFIYVDISSIDRERKCISDAKVLESTAAPSRAKQVLQSGDVLISMTRPNLNAIAMATSEFHGGIGSTGFHVLRSKWVESKFLFYLVHTREFIEKMCLCVQGALYPAVRPNDIASFSFSLPPRPEQHRIVAKIEELFSELDKGVESMKTAQAQLKVYRQALLKHAFEGKLTAQWRAENQDKLETSDALLKRIQHERAERYQQQLADWQTNGGTKPKAPKSLPPLTAEELAELPELPDGWAYTRVGAVIDDPTYGTSKKCDYEVDGVGVLRIPNVVSGKVDAADLKFAQFEDDEIATYKLIAGDILIIRSNGSISIVGRCALVSNADLDYLYAGYLIRLRPHQRLIEPGYLLNTLSLHSVRKQIEQKAKSTSGVNNINTGEIQSLVVAVCGIEEQKQIQMKIESHLSEVEQLELTIATSLQQSEALRQSILKKAFSGQLVPQNPHDEPASELLARIKAERAGVVAKPRKNVTGNRPLPVATHSASTNKES